MPLKVAGADLLFKGGLFSGNKYVGLIDPDDSEFADNNYSRQLATGFGGAGFWQADGNEYENRQTLTFPQPTGAAWPAAAKWGLYSASTAGSLLLDVDISPDTAAPQIGAMVSAAAEAIAVGISGITVDGSLLSMQSGFFSGTRAITLHTGAPGTTGARAIFTDGVVWDGSNEGSKTLVNVSTTAANWTLSSVSTPDRRRARNNTILSYGQQTADLPAPTHVALRDGTAVNSKVLWSSTMTANDPGLGATLRFLANTFAFYFPVDA